MSAALCIQLSLEFRIGPPSFNGLAPSTWLPLGRYTIHPLSRLEPTGLAGHLDCTAPLRLLSITVGLLPRTVAARTAHI
jgi:hypothetical protein